MNGKKEDVKEVEKNQEKVKNLGGLFIIGTERHESRRIDNQLRGRDLGDKEILGVQSFL